MPSCNDSSKDTNTQQRSAGRKKMVASFIVFVLIAAVIGGYFLVTKLLPGDDLSDEKSDARNRCEDGGSECDHGDGLERLCDKTTNTCRIRPGQHGVNCNDSSPCVNNATKVCDTNGTGLCECDALFLPRLDGTCGIQTGQTALNCSVDEDCVDHAHCSHRNGTTACVCNTTVSLQMSDGTCGVLVGHACQEGTTCVQHALCDVNNTQKCMCDNSYVPMADGTCGLKVGPRGQNCTSSPCVEHSTCDLGNTDRCVCDSNYGSKMDGSCGIQTGQTALNCSVDEDCVDHAHCSYRNGTTACVCNSAVSLQMSDGTCGVLVGRACQEATACVQHAHCDVNNTHTCVCDSTHAPSAASTCGLRAGSDCQDTTDCGDHAVCSEHKCACVDSERRSDGLCALHVGETQFKCTAASLCVENATCDVGNTDKCVCDTHFTHKADGTCGLKPGVAIGTVRHCSQIRCADHAVCSVAQSGAVCGCEKKYKEKDGQCHSTSGAIDTKALKMSIALAFTVTAIFRCM